MGEIRKKIQIIAGGAEPFEVDALVDTGTNRTVIKEKFFEDRGIKSTAQFKHVEFSGEKQPPKNAYTVDILFNGCYVDLLTIAGGNKNLIGRDILQQFGAKIDEENDTVTFTRCPKAGLEVGGSMLELGDLKLKSRGN